MTRILLFKHSTKPRATLFSGLQYAAMPSSAARSCRRSVRRFKALQLQLRAPVVEEVACPDVAVAIPQLGKRLLEHIGCFQALVGGQQQSQILPGRAGEVLRVGEQGVLLMLDEVALTEEGLRESERLLNALFCRQRGGSTSNEYAFCRPEMRNLCPPLTRSWNSVAYDRDIADPWRLPGVTIHHASAGCGFSQSHRYWSRFSAPVYESLQRHARRTS
jgi:hypothetical protein